MEIEGINIDDYFPYKKDGKASYRPYQKDGIEKALKALLEQDYELFFLDCPVGYGKSGVLITVLRVIENLGKSGYLTTPQIVLQDQFEEEFVDIPQIKGRRNYKCVDDFDPNVMCDEGECQLDEKYDCPNKGNCVYALQRDKCINSRICGMNTSYMMTVRRELFDQRFMYVCDESHSVPEWAVGHVAVNIREDDVGMIPVFDKGFEAYLIWLEKMVYPKTKEREDQLRERLKSFGKGKRKAILGAFDEHKRLKELNKKIELLSYDYSENGEDWIYQIVDDKRGRKIMFQPLTSGRFLEHILWARGEKVVLSSGTIEPEIYIKEGGLQNLSFDIKDCVISVPSEFPPEKSPIYYKSLGKMTNDKKDTTFPLVLKEIEKVLFDRIDRKGIIHTFSYANAKYLIDNIDPVLRNYLWVQDQSDRSGSLQKWIEYDKPSTFLSTNMTEGLNLKDDLCRYQIYLKIGFPNTQDKRVAKRLELGHWLWYYMQAIEDLEQASGRATRSKDDWSEMFIYDSSFATVFTKYGKYLKPWFKQRMKFIQV